MDIPRKLEIARASIASIATHTDMDANVLLASLDALKADITAKEGEIRAYVAADIAAALAPREADEAA